MNTAELTKERAIEALDELRSIVCDVGISINELRVKADDLFYSSEDGTVCRMLGLAIRKRLDDALDIFEALPATANVQEPA